MNAWKCNNCSDEKIAQYRVSILYGDYVVDLYKNEISSFEPDGEMLDDYFCLFILFYLMKVQNISVSGVWVSEKDITGGSAFFSGGLTWCRWNVLSKEFPMLSASLMTAARKLEGIPLDFADSSFLFEAVPSVSVAVLYWMGNEDLKGEAKLMFDKTIEQHLLLDITWALCLCSV